MTITQTVEIPAEGLRTIEVPREVPAGKVILTFTPVAELNMIDFKDASKEEVSAAGAKIIDKHISAFKALEELVK
ncbi:MAG: hypothetical protein FWC21_04060 [Treponema sp.]|nr:hypothetical protein [Treponema sp.]